MLTEIKEKLVGAIEETLKEKGLSVDNVSNLIEVPKDFSHGHFSMPVFFLAKQMRKSPMQIAEEISGELNKRFGNASKDLSDFSEVSAIKGFINFKVKTERLQSVLFDNVNSSTENQNLGFSTEGKGKTLTIDYSSPNVAKPMSIGHLRATVIGQAIRNLAETQGYKVIGINHLGDWGVQFGKLAWAYQEWKEEYPFDEQPFDSLFKLYVRFHSEAEQNPELNKKGAATFKKLEDGDSEITKIWQMFLDVSLKECQILWDRLGVKHDLVRGESFFNDKLKETEKRLESMGLLEGSQGASVVQIGDDVPPCLIRKSDGGSLYATRDLAAAIYRREELGADLNLYVVGMDQDLHFKQIFRVLERMDYSWAKNCHHVSFGMYRFPEGKMSTRKGNVIFLEDVLNKAVELAKEVIASKNPSLKNKDKIAEQVGIGAIIFNDLFNDRVRNVDFDWGKVLDFDGASGPYIQYCHVRCNSLINKYREMYPDKENGATVEDTVFVLDSLEERALIYHLLNYSDALQKSFEGFRPNILAHYLLEVCRLFNHFYQKHQILKAADPLRSTRIKLVQSTKEVLMQGLGVLNIQAPEAM